MEILWAWLEVRIERERLRFPCPLLSGVEQGLLGLIYAFLSWLCLRRGGLEPFVDWPSNPNRLSLMLMRGGLEPFIGWPSNPGRLSLMLNETTVASCRDAKRRDAIIAYAMLGCMRMDE